MSFGKIRTHFGDDVLGLAQWVGRKVRNHDPMSERDKGRARSNRLEQSPGGVKHGVASVTMVNEGVESPVVLYGMADGRLFEIQVREVHPAAYAKAKRVAVGS